MSSFVIVAIVSCVTIAYYILMAILKWIIFYRCDDNTIVAISFVPIDFLVLTVFIYDCIRFGLAGGPIGIAGGLLISLWVFTTIVYFIYSWGCNDLVQDFLIILFAKLFPKKYRNWVIGYQPLYDKKVVTAAKPKASKMESKLNFKS